MKKKLVISFSGGRTSAFMMWWTLNEWDDRHNWDIVVVFANTGKESEATLQFVRDCEIHWNIIIHWVEYTAGSVKGWAVIPKITNFALASRKGEPFEEMISHTGIPTTNVPMCSKILKANTIRAYMRGMGWKGYYVAIGIRSDEIDRISENYKKDRVLYPLISFRPTKKPEIIRWFKDTQPFDLLVHEDEGNCDGCWKKDFPRLVRIAKRKPEIFEWWQEMTDKYGEFNPRNSKLKPPFNFYRGNMSPKDIIKLSLLPQQQILELTESKKLNSCSESCEAF